jgi:hypothetical protein
MTRMSLPTYTPYIQARLEDAKALEAVKAAQAAVYEARQLASRVGRTFGRAHAEENFLKPAMNRLAQAKRRAEAAEVALTRAWGFHQAAIQEAKARKVAAKTAHQQYQAKLKRAA